MENIGTRTWAEIKRLRVIDRWIEIKSFSYTHIIIILSWLERRRRRDRERESLEQTDRLTEWKTTKFVRNVQFKERERETNSAWEKEREGETVYTWWGSKRESEREQDCMRKKKREREREGGREIVWTPSAHAEMWKFFVSSTFTFSFDHQFIFLSFLCRQFVLNFRFCKKIWIWNCQSFPPSFSALQNLLLPLYLIPSTSLKLCRNLQHYAYS